MRRLTIAIDLMWQKWSRGLCNEIAIMKITRSYTPRCRAYSSSHHQASDQAAKARHHRERSRRCEMGRRFDEPNNSEIVGKLCRGANENVCPSSSRAREAVEVIFIIEHFVSNLESYVCAPWCMTTTAHCANEENDLWCLTEREKNVTTQRIQLRQARALSWSSPL